MNGKRKSQTAGRRRQSGTTSTRGSLLRGRGRGTPTQQRRTAGQRTSEVQEIPRNQWVRFFDVFSKNHDGWLIEVVVAGRGNRSRVEARRLPLQGITVDLKTGD